MPGWDWLWCAEIEPFPAWVMAKRHGAGRPQRMPDPDEAGLSDETRLERRAAIRAVAKLPEKSRCANLGDVNAEDFVERALEAGRPDVIVWGAPCQDFSVAGKRAGMDGARGNMALVGLRIIRDIRPRWMVYENVPGLLSSYSGSAEAEGLLRDRAAGCDEFEGLGDGESMVDAEEDSDFAAFLSAIRECGYLGCYRILDAQHGGVPQRRRRVFFVGHLGDWRPSVAVLFDADSMRGNPPPSRETRQGAAGTITSSIARRGGTDEGDRGTLISGTLGSRAGVPGSGLESEQDFLVPEVANPLTARMEKGVNTTMDEGQTMVVTPILEAGARTGRRGHEGVDGLGVGNPGDPMFSLQSTKQHAIAFDCKAGGETSFAVGEVAGALRGEGHGGGHAAVMAFSGKDHGADVSEDVAPTLRSMEFDHSHANGGGHGETSDMRPVVVVPSGVFDGEAVAFKPSFFTRRDKDGAPDTIVPPLSADADKGDQDPVMMAGTAVRRLTPVECERLQKFPDGFTAVTFNGKPAADGNRYRALGNSMAVCEVGWILGRIEMFETKVRR